MTDHGPALNPASAYLVYALAALALIVGLCVLLALTPRRRDYGRRANRNPRDKNP